MVANMILMLILMYADDGTENDYAAGGWCEWLHMMAGDVWPVAMF